VHSSRKCQAPGPRPEAFAFNLLSSTYLFVMRGLDPRIHSLASDASLRVDGRVKPGHDESIQARERPRMTR
ncbi:MAG: hypothetical protein ACLP8B_15840, partial [Xanthobacteraceae bacterium]